MLFACVILATQGVDAQLPNEPGVLASRSGAFGSGPQITFAGPPFAEVARYAKYEVGFALDREYDNPFDPEQISVEAVFKSPSGETIRVPGFFYQDYPAASVRREESFEGQAGTSGWRIRFAPSESGTFQGKIIARDRAGQKELKLPEFVVSPSDNRGFIHCTAGTNGRTVFDSGRMFMPIGECLWMPRTLEQFEQEFAEYEKHGMNYCRFFTSHDSMFCFENSRRPVGQYDLFILRKLDYLFDAMAARGVYAMPCLEMFADFRVTQPYPYWEQNPYNGKNGGPCMSVSDFFVNAEARRLYKNRLRYFVARYGYSTNLFCLQLFAEANYIEHYDMTAVRTWHQEMAAYLRSIDPYGHPVSTSMAAWDSQDKTLFALPEMDLVLNEVYNARDFAGELARDNWDILAEYSKPVFLAEAGLTFEYLGVTDSSGLHIHNAIWANPLSGGIGVPSFWWTSYIREKNLLPHFKVFSDFIKGEDFTGLEPVEARISTPKSTGINPDLIIPYPYIDPPGSKGRQTITLPSDRFIEHELPNMPHVFYPRSRLDGKPDPDHNPITFLADFPAEGNLIILPRWVAGPGASSVRLQVRVDDQLVKEIQYPGCPTEDWKAFLNHSQTTCVPTVVNISKGHHRIVLDNAGTLACSASVDFANILKSDVPNLRVLGMGDGERAYLWVQNRDNTWWRNCLGKKPRVVKSASVSLTGLRRGPYDVEWWNTYDGTLVRRERMASRDGTLELKVENLESDLACKVRKAVPTVEKHTNMNE